MINGPAIPLPSGNYHATVEAIYTLGRDTRFAVIGGTINPADVSPPFSMAEPRLYDIHFVVPDDSCRLVSLTMTASGADLARMRIVRE